MKQSIPPFRGQYIPLSQRLIQGAIGKQYVIKHYRKKRMAVKTKYPNMQGIVPSTRQKISRRTFRKAVRYAQCIFWNAAQKAEWHKKLRKPRRLFQALMKVYYKQKAESQSHNLRRLHRWQRHLQSSGQFRSRFVINDSSFTTCSVSVVVVKDHSSVCKYLLSSALTGTQQKSPPKRAFKDALLFRVI